MRNRELANDYIKRCKARVGAIKFLYQQKSWPDVVRESQEVVELALKALLRHFNIEVPRVHDVSPVLELEKEKFSPEIQKAIPKMIQISKSLRRDRELAYYGSEDLTPSEFYSEEDGKQALSSAEFVVNSVAKAMGAG